MAHKHFVWAGSTLPISIAIFFVLFALTGNHVYHERKKARMASFITPYRPRAIRRGAMKEREKSAFYWDFQLAWLFINTLK